MSSFCKNRCVKKVSSWDGERFFLDWKHPISHRMSLLSLFIGRFPLEQIYLSNKISPLCFIWWNYKAKILLCSLCKERVKKSKHDAFINFIDQYTGGSKMQWMFKYQILLSIGSYSTRLVSNGTVLYEALLGELVII